MKAYLWSANDGNASWTVMGVKDPGKVRNRQVENSRIVFIPILINNVGRSVLLGLPRKQKGRPVECSQRCWKQFKSDQAMGLVNSRRGINGRTFPLL